VDQPTEPETIVTLTGYYYTYDDMKKDLAGLAARYPDTMSYRSYGISADGRDLYVATLGNPDAPKQVIITAGMHAREYVNPFVVMQQLEYYLAHYDTVRYDGHMLRDLFTEVCFVIVPMTNPDGITLAQEGIDAIRSEEIRQTVRDICGDMSTKALNDYLNMYWKSNALGVDINRNFDVLWNEHYDGVGRPSVKNYKGTAAMSEVETAYLVALTESLSNPVASVCLHSQGEIIYWRCFQEGALEVQNERLAKIAARVTGYGIIDENQSEPSYSNWTILAHGIPTITVETGLMGYPQNHGTMASGIYDRTRDLWAAVAVAYAGLAKG
jgi:g-D-glutamyl-meso-diaminopimelate peptidase